MMRGASPRPIVPVHAAAPLAGRWDVVVVGAGLVGLLAAYEVHRRGMRVAVIEARRVGSRASGHGMGMATVLRADRFSAIRLASGLDTAAECAHWSLGGVERLGTLVDQLHLACGWTPSTTYVCATTDAGAAVVDGEATALSSCGITTYASTTEELPFRTSAALAFDGGAHLDPHALCVAMAAVLEGAGVPVVEDSRVRSVEEDRRGVRLILADGTVHADRVVLATGFPIAGSSRLVGRLWATRERVVAGVSSALSGRLRGMYTAVDDDRWSCRPRGGAGDGWTLLAGGAQQLRSIADPQVQREQLVERAEGLLAMQVARAWSLPGVATDSGVPLVGPIARRSKCLTATGLGQWGPAGAAAAAVTLADLLAGGEARAAKAFDPSRVGARLRIGVPSLRASLPTLPTLPLSPGSGMVARSGRSAVAVSSDSVGQSVQLSARCSHRGCVVRFDDAEKEWECPCHGSRFDLSGGIIDGPATTPLAPFRTRP